MSVTRKRVLEGTYLTSQVVETVRSIGRAAVGSFGCRPEYTCEQPFRMRYLPFKEPLDTGPELGATVFYRHVRCRKCAGCLRQKRAMWVARAISEAEECAVRGRRTWLLTATHKIRPSNGGDALFERAINLALKRLRKLGKYRYLLVFERHATRAGERVGYPHCHALIHETDRLLYADFKLVFSPIGFFEAKLLQGEPSRAAGYVAKYMTKGEGPAVCRVRASKHYGGSVAAAGISSNDDEAESSLVDILPKKTVATTSPETFSGEVL